MSASNEDAESVDQFLARIASLKDRRDREDEERTRKLEEEIAQGRKERQARRAERARSLSPPKASPAPSVSSLAEPKNISSRSIEPPVDFSPRSQRLTPTKPSYLQSPSQLEEPTTMTPSESRRPLPTPPSQSPAPTFTPTNTTTLSRSGTLSWQQRPSSRDSNSSRPRPLSGVPSPAASPALPSLASKSTDDLSRAQIAQSLSSKDPSWFRQTSDRGASSPAYRKRQVENGPESGKYTDRESTRLPGMSRESTAEPERPVTPRDGYGRKKDLQSSGAQRDSASGNDLFSGAASTLSAPKSEFAAPLAKPAMSELAAKPESLQLHPNHSSGPNADRPPSPTKGLGGFVQSAMMKRSDSVNKRWSVQAGSGLKRGDSIASNRSTLAAANTGGFVAPLSRSPTRASRTIGNEPPSSPLTSSRPSSSHANDSLTTESSTAQQLDVSSSEALREKNIAVSTSSHSLQEEPKVDSDVSLPVSPSKTMDSRRWSPTKSSWLESALARPDSPKITAPKFEQPAWKADLNRPKAMKTPSEDISSPGSGYEVVATGGLLRLPPPGGHARPLSISGMPEGFSSGLNKAKRDQSPTKLMREPISTHTDPPASINSELQPKPMSVEKSKDQDEISSTHSRPEPKAGTVLAEKSKASPIVKPKPQTPPKTDFRSNLKSRQTDADQSNNAEPEFKAVFGKLKRTQTKNYVAPDELKDNITRGKMGLNTTGGPQKTKRVDEFKESILQKKESMKETKSESRPPSVPEKPSTVLPEALTRRQTLKQANNSSTVICEKQPSKEQGLTSQSGSDIVPKQQTVSKPSWAKPASKEQKDTLLTEDYSPKDLASLPTTDSKDETPMFKAREAAETSKLAARLNPSLAGFLSRSSSPKPVTNTMSEEASTSRRPQTPSSTVGFAADDSSATLTHMTKARAKGPKRRAPKAERVPASPLVTKSERSESSRAPAATPKPVVATPKFEGKAIPSPAVEPPQKTLISRPSWKPAPAKALEDSSTPEPKTKKVISLEGAPAATKSKPKPEIIAKSPELRKVSSPPESMSSTIRPNSRAPAAQNFDIAADQASKEAIVNDSEIKPPSTPSKPAKMNASPLTPSTSNINSTRVSKTINTEVPQKSSELKTSLQSRGLGLNFDKPLIDRGVIIPSEPTPPPEKPPYTTKHSAQPVEDHGAVISQELSTIFGQTPKARDKAEFDIKSIMQPSQDDEKKIKTLNMQIWEINGDGKKQNMPPQQEHILFEECMYLCTHTFQGMSGSKSTDVYLWCGDGVAGGAVEDAQLFCRKVARENSTKLEVVKQGKEPAYFFQALGGILITRRSKSSALYMLCGRRHLGHVCFDEVEMDVVNLCSGFPYIVSAKFGRLYLWKGRGSSADELGCARLIGMDLGLTGEIEEIEEGKEPAAFLESFSNGPASRTSLSELWELKATQDKYACKLYRIEHDRPKSAGSFWGRRASSPPKSSNKALVHEISPYCQRDLEPGQIHVLDAYFEIYVFVGPNSMPKNAEFVTATMLAQDMSILAPSLQDRPLMPVCHVVFGEPPINFRANFRKWQPSRSGGATEESSLLPLEQVIEAME